MKPLRNLLALAVTGGLLALGSSLHAQTSPDPTNSTPRAARRGGMAPVETQLKRLTHKLKLTEKQQPKVKAVLEERVKKLTALREDRSLPRAERRAKVQSIHEEVNRKMKSILTSSQYEKYQSLIKLHGRGPHKKGRAAKDPANGDSTP